MSTKPDRMPDGHVHRVQDQIYTKVEQQRVDLLILLLFCLGEKKNPFKPAFPMGEQQDNMLHGPNMQQCLQSYGIEPNVSETLAWGQ